MAILTSDFIAQLTIENIGQERLVSLDELEPGLVGILAADRVVVGVGIASFVSGTIQFFIHAFEDKGLRPRWRNEQNTKSSWASCWSPSAREGAIWETESRMVLGEMEASLPLQRAVMALLRLMVILYFSLASSVYEWREWKKERCWSIQFCHLRSQRRLLWTRGRGTNTIEHDYGQISQKMYTCIAEATKQVFPVFWIPVRPLLICLWSFSDMESEF